MSNFQKKILIWLIALALCSPIGIYLPELFHSGDAWGEWDTETIKENTGFVPEGMAKEADLWKAPVADYQLKEESSFAKKSFDYILSGIIGLIFTIFVTFIITRLIQRNEQSS